ncbi:uncharacterized protein LOC119476813 [Sebastes umbrosus]|uniref:uncharacterized protein LOC119476813 n=1 Tax=Sebastes umbrosus TaxID=72105 RepID=UPI0018A00DB4|nr:uncharacterized protein LOC119476813 [Sebastes umbrosus]
MDEFRGIQTALFLMLLLQFTGAATRQSFLSLAVRDGDEITLPCNSVRDDQNNCDRTRWIYTDSSSRTADLVRDGQIDKQAEDKSDRRVTENCSLVIKKLTEKDDGRYDCRQIRSGQRLSPDAVVYLSFVTMTEQKNSDEVTLNCSVSILYRRCKHTVKWLFQGLDVEKDNGDLKTSQSLCSASVTFRTSHYNQTSSYQSLKCNVTDRVTGTPQLFPFRLSGEETTTESPTTTCGNCTEAGNST